jgi:hypothetical protein
MKSSYRRALMMSLACSIVLPATIAFADAGADGVAVGNVAVSLQIKQQCQINSTLGNAVTATAAPVVACDFDQPYETLLSNDDADATPATPLTTGGAVATVATAQTANRAKFWTVVF